MAAGVWETVREFALALPNAAEDFPWGESVIKVEKRGADPPRWRQGLVHLPMFLWLGSRDEPQAMSVKLTDSHEHAVAVANGTSTTTSGLGQWGWLTVRLSAVDVELLCEWVDESYRNVAPKKLVAELDARSRPSRAKTRHNPISQSERDSAAVEGEQR